MFKRFGILSLVLAGATLLQPTAIFAEGVFHNGKNTTIVERKTEYRGEQSRRDRGEQKVEVKRVETRVTGSRTPSRSPDLSQGGSSPLMDRRLINASSCLTFFRRNRRQDEAHRNSRKPERASK